MTPLTIAIVAMVVVAGILLALRPKLMFTRQGRFKPFGTGPTETLLPFWLGILVAGVVTYWAQK